jgi:hypothetical protein
MRMNRCTGILVRTDWRGSLRALIGQISWEVVAGNFIARRPRYPEDDHFTHNSTTRLPTRYSLRATQSTHGVVSTLEVTTPYPRGLSPQCGAGASVVPVTMYAKGDDPLLIGNTEPCVGCTTYTKPAQPSTLHNTFQRNNRCPSRVCRLSADEERVFPSIIGPAQHCKMPLCHHAAVQQWSMMYYLAV